MTSEGEDEAAAIERQLEEQLQEQRSSLAAVDEALAADPSNSDLLEVHEELLAAIKDAEAGLVHLKHSRVVKQADEIFPNEESISQAPEVAAEPLVPDDVDPEPLEPHSFSVGSKCRFRHNNGRWYNGCIIGFEGSSNARISFLTPTSENMMNQYPSLDQGCSFSFRLFCCWILCTDGMRTGSPRMSSSGTWLCWLSQLSATLLHSLSRVFFSTGSLHLDMTADSTCSSLSLH